MLRAYRASPARPTRPCSSPWMPCCACQGQVLLIRRGHAPGAGPVALPGGFVEPTTRCGSPACANCRSHVPGLEGAQAQRRCYEPSSSERSRDRQAPENETKTASGIVIPDNAAEKPDQGEVLAVGPGKLTKTATVAMKYARRATACCSANTAARP